jgi:hypothetical protein
VASLAAVALLGSLPLIAQEPAPAKSAEKTAPASKKSDPTRRVPSYFGQVGLSTEQRESIYKIRGKHQPRIQELQKQIDSLRAEELRECETVLTDSQKQQLQQFRAAAAAKKKQATAKPKESGT